MSIESLMTQLTTTLERDGRVTAVFGEPLKLEHHTIVPVAVISGGGGVGGGQATPTAGFSGGGGVGLNVRPVGFIHENGSEVVFTPIHIDIHNKPLWTEAAIAVRRATDIISKAILQLMNSRRASHAVDEIPMSRATEESSDQIGAPS